MCPNKLEFEHLTVPRKLVQNAFIAGSDVDEYLENGML